MGRQSLPLGLKQKDTSGSYRFARHGLVLYSISYSTLLEAAETCPISNTKYIMSICLRAAHIGVVAVLGLLEKIMTVNSVISFENLS